MKLVSRCPSHVDVNRRNSALQLGPFEKKGGKYIPPPKFWRQQIDTMKTMAPARVRLEISLADSEKTVPGK